VRITRIRTFPVRIPLKPKYHMLTALGRHEVSEYLLVRIETDAGIDGAGEATVSVRWSGETVPGAQALIEQVFSPLLVGRDPRDLEAIDRTLDTAARLNWFVKSAIEMACQDIRGKDAGRPVYELLGGPARPLAIRSRFSMGAFPPERARQRAAELVAEGFTTIKVKVGTGDLEEDIARVRAVREAIGPDCELTIDANCGYDVPTAIEAARRMAAYRVVLFEQPTPQRDFGGLAEVRRNVSCEVMADDIVFDLDDARECLRNNACHVISVYPGKNGGIRKSRQIVELAAAHNVACTIGSNLELDVASAAMAHLVVACPNMQVERYPGDLLGPAYHEFSIAKDPLAIEGPLTTITDRPGLGVEVDWDAVKRAQRLHVASRGLPT
jgi:muconate cycloisomerase